MTTGVLVMAHGTPAQPSDVEEFYTRIRRGQPPSPELLADLVRRYEAIGGTSPLTELSVAQAAGVAYALEQRAPGRYVVELGNKHTEPFIEDAGRALAARAPTSVVGVVLAPHESSLSTAQYHQRAAAAVAPLPYRRVRPWFDDPAFISLQAERLRQALAAVPGSRRATTAVLFTAHSLPTRVVTEGENYPEQLERSAAAVAAIVPLPRWSIAWQSAGRTADPWLGPDLLGVVRELPADGVTDVVVCPIGFVSDHLEVLFDLDIEAAGVARQVGVGFSRTSSLNDDPAFTSFLADLVTEVA